MKENHETVTLNIPILEILVVLGIILIVLGFLAPIQHLEFLGFDIWFDPKLGYFTIPIGSGLVCGYITKKILQNSKYAYTLGFILGIIGIIISICIKVANSQASHNKYEDLQKLSELNKKGIITDKEFTTEKEKIFKER